MKKIESNFQPVAPLLINRILLATIVILALLAGYFHAKYTSQISRYNRLERKYFQLEQKYDTVLETNTAVEELPE